MGVSSSPDLSTLNQYQTSDKKPSIRYWSIGLINFRVMMKTPRNNLYLLQVIDDFVKSVKGTEITIISQEIFEHDPLTRVENLKVKTFNCTCLRPEAAFSIVSCVVSYFCGIEVRVRVKIFNCTGLRPVVAAYQRRPFFVF